MSTPSSQICICSGVRLTNRYDHTIKFDTQSSQEAYFNSKVVKTFSSYTYLRKNWNIKVLAGMDNANTWSYLFFTNANKKYYYFITDVQYINDDTVELSLELDVMQTYAFDYKLRDCFVVREHIAEDGVGVSMTDEGLDTGELIVAKHTQTDIGELVVVIQTPCNLRLIEASAMDITDEGKEAVYAPVYASKFGGCYHGCNYYCVEMENASGLSGLLDKIDTHGKIDVIWNIFMYPKSLLRYATSEDFITNRIEYTASIEHSLSPYVNSIDGYYCKNKKLLQYPYNIYYITNNNGGSAMYRPELFGDYTDPYFKVVGCVSPDGTAKCYPLNYKGMQHNFDEGVTMGNYPMCAWNSDPYKLWVAQNQHQQDFNKNASIGTIIGGVATTLLGAATFNPKIAVAGLGMVGGGAMQIGSQIAQNKDRDVQPPQARGRQSVSVNVTNGWQTFDVIQKTITKEQAKIIDDYFHMYGYKCNQVKKPNINSRPNFNYVKTINSNVGGDIPQNDLGKINAIFDNGITFWKNGDVIGDYSVNNY